MGLDMNLYGEKSTFGNKETVDGFPVASTNLDIGYWRKHANLHGYIVERFADGRDDCQKIHLDADDLGHLIEVLENDEIYEKGEVTGFFFGRSYFPGEEDGFGSYEEQKNRDIDIFTKARNWLMGNVPTSEWRSVYYQASW